LASADFLDAVWRKYARFQYELNAHLGKEMQVLLVAVSIVLSYLLGAIPIGVLVGRCIGGVEVRQVGSGRTGTTNVYRATGRWGAALTVLGDGLKGILAVWIARALTHSPWVEALAGIAVVGGHNWSIFLKFKGGAGTITTLGVVGAMNHWVIIALTACALIVLAISRMASAASIAIALLMGVALIVSAILGETPWAYVLFGVVSGAFTIYALRPNIMRILTKKERQLKTDY